MSYTCVASESTQHLFHAGNQSIDIVFDSFRDLERLIYANGWDHVSDQ
jgi:hypothetical protein